MNQLVDTVPSDEEVEAYAEQAYVAFHRYQNFTHNIGEPLWRYLRHDLKSFWLGQARMTLSVYAYNSNPVEEGE